MNVLLILIILQNCLLFVKNCVSIDNNSASSNINLCDSNYVIVYPQIFHTSKRTRRDLSSNFFYEYDEHKKTLKLDDDWVLELQSKNNLIVPEHVQVQWINDKKTSRTLIAYCEYTSGIVSDAKNSFTVITICNNNINGYFKVDNEIYFIQPLNSSSNQHVLYKNSLNRRKRSMIPTTDDRNNNKNNEEKWEYFNLTGDVIDIGTNERPEDIQQINLTFFNGTNKPEKPRKLYREQFDSDELGYFYDSAWETNTYSGFVKAQKNLSMKERRWIEIAIGVDYSVISFHGKHNVEKYVLSLMNIVNGIFQDPSLDANIQLVITRLLLYETKRHSLVQRGNATKSLLNVNHWNKRLHLSLAPGESSHDLAIWLTRNDIGGPSGYAPLGGVCDSNRSCSLNRDEGLSSAFIIAHEMGHILGLSHDGDKKSGNDCIDDSQMGSIMAPMVTATFNKFLWSDCSRREFQHKVSKWKCLLNEPENNLGIFLNTTLGYEFTLDEQCRMEFGKGYISCRSFEITEPCTHLWCEKDRSLMCKTKKGPPVEGTQCGFNKWCINEYCQNIDMQRVKNQVLHLNPVNGGWNNWTIWSTCSRSCGIGVEFRTRVCDNPEPMYGGKECDGSKEEWRICKKQQCPEPLADLRAQQCKNIPDSLNVNLLGNNITLMPFESKFADEKCKLICKVKETGELYKTEDNLIDGTSCSYDNGNNICVQGKCQVLGCDGILFSKIIEDDCGICNGNNTECEHVKSTYRKRLKREESKIARIPRMTRNIMIEVNVSFPHDTISQVVFIFKERKKRIHSVMIPNKHVFTNIIEGTKFYYEKNDFTHKIWGRGPLLSELYLFFQTTKIDKSLNITVQSQYDIHKSLTNSSTRFQWIIGGWGPCSSSCGGGKRIKTVACFDIRNNKIVPRRRCSFITKPKLDVEKCNTFNCSFNWIPGAWEPCSATCGSYGTQQREIYCVPHTDNNNATLNYVSENKTYEIWKTMVNPTKCVGLQPNSRKPCNRIPCPSNWEYREWSQCSVSCGQGFSTRQPHCPPPDDETFFSCGPSPYIQKRKCRGLYKRNNKLCKPRKRRPCIKDQTKYCTLPILTKYCKIRSFRRICCKSCTSHHLNPVIAGISE